jgi:SlyX protein
MSTSTDLEERIAHLTRLVEDLSDVVVAQGKRLERAERQLTLLIERELEREGGLTTPPAADQRPPHW